MSELVEQDVLHLIQAAYLKGREDERQHQADTKARAYERAEVERTRWGSGGRKHFADPRPGDFSGRQHDSEREAEA